MVEGVIAGVAAVGGVVLGSFAGVLASRLPKGESWIGGRSRCDQCGQTLGRKDLVPVLSFVIQKGKCRYCKKPLGWQVLAIELMMGAGFGAIGWWASREGALAGIGVLGWQEWPAILRTMLAFLSFFGLNVIFWADLKEQIIPDEIVQFLAVVSGIMLGLVAWGSWQERLAAAGLGGGFFILLFLITKGRGWGWGDVKLAGLLGVLMGKFLAVALYTALVGGSITALLLIATKRKKWGQKIALGPFLVAGTLVALAWGEKIWGWYRGNFLL